MVGGKAEDCTNASGSTTSEALHLNLLIRAEILDNLMDMFAEDGTTDQILIRNNLLARFVIQENVFSDLFRQFRKTRERILANVRWDKMKKSAAGQSVPEGKERGGESVNQNQASADARPGNVCVMNRQELAVIQTVAYNFKRFIRYKAKMLARTGNKNKKKGSQFI